MSSNTSLWARLDRHVDALLDLPEAERGKYLDELSRSDEVAARILVQELANGLEEATLRLSSSFDQLLERDDVVPSTGSLPPLHSLGPYRLLELLGSGGMGEVYRAERVDGQFEQEVAIKVLKRNAGPFHQERFLQERRLLAQLEHPHIARLLDGGVDDGTIFLVMELVDGLPITEHCDTYGLELDQRLALFRDACAAVAHAHQRLIVHRDLKPANILVSRDEVEGDRVKLLDFGIAKLLDPAREGALDTPHTQTGLFLLTPDYAAPEQVSGAPVTTTTDVYALGMVLYELVVGERAYSVGGLRGTEMMRAICDTVPAKPSSIAGGQKPGKSGEARAGERPSSGSVTWAATLRGDLDTIVLKALRKEPENRYEAVSDLAEDLELWQEGKPIRARPSTSTYLLSKFIRRHRAAVVAVALMGVTVLIGLVTLALEQQKTAVALKDARVEASRSERLRQFTIGLFDAANPLHGGEDVSARDLLERGIGRLAELDDEPLVKSEMQSSIGSALRGLGDFEGAEGLYREAIRLGEENGADPLELSPVRCSLGSVLYDARRFNDAEVVLQESRDILATLDPVASMSARACNVVTFGHSALAQGRYEDAEAHFREGLDLLERFAGEPDLMSYSALSGIGFARAHRGNWEEGIEWSLDALSALREIVDQENHASIATELSNIGAFSVRLGRFDEATDYHRQALEMKKKVYPEGHPSVATSLNNLGGVEMNRARFDEARRYFEDALDMYVDRLGDDHPDLVTTLGNLFYVAKQQGDLESAGRFNQRAYEIGRRAYGELSPRMSSVWAGFGLLWEAEERWADAERAYRNELASVRAGDPESPFQLRPLEALARLSGRAGDTAQARAFLEEALPIARRELAEDDPRVRAIEEGLGLQSADPIRDLVN